jgi:hypothetical protein
MPRIIPIRDLKKSYSCWMCMKNWLKAKLI